MKGQLKTILSLSIAASIILPISLASANHNGTVKVSITNISNTVFTPPLVALCRKWTRPIASIGKTASDNLEPLAEGGDTSALAEYFTNNNCSTAAATAPILPGETLTLELAGGRNHFLHMASMLLPTNDAFIFTSNRKVRHIKKRGKLRLKSFDAGTEFNDELCANIPGPQCGGEGFNAARETNNFVKPHPGIQGVGDVAADIYNWGEPVAFIKVR